MKKKPKKLEPVWGGPEDGISFSNLSKWLVGRHRFYLLAVHGLKEIQGFNHRMEYGTYFHSAEEYHDEGRDYRKGIRSHVNKLRKKYPGKDEEINKWAEICRVQFPIYLDHLKKTADNRRMKYLFREKGFKVPILLPSGRTVNLTGIIDGVYRLGKAVSIQEDKTKGDIDEKGISQTVTQNLQAMIYFVCYNQLPKLPPASGILYNVIRRPLSDRYAIRPRKDEQANPKRFYKRLGEVIRKDAERYFYRWHFTVTAGDVKRFKQETLYPILEQLCDWWEWIKVDPENPFRMPTQAEVRKICNCSGGGVHFRFPFGVYNSLAGGFRGDYFEYLTTGRKTNLETVTTLKRPKE